MSDAIKYVVVHGKWLERTEFNNAVPGEALNSLCAVLPPMMSDEEEDETIERLFDDDRIFYVFSADETIIGNHYDFSVESYEYVDYISSGVH